MPTVLLDAGPLVALLDPGDPFHAWVRESLDATPVPVQTCEPVLAESAYLLRKVPGAAAGVLDLVARGYVEVKFRVEAEAAALRDLIKRYQSVPMSLADACLVRMTELDPRSSVMTLDSGFRIYRRGGRGVIPVIMPH